MKMSVDTEGEECEEGEGVEEVEEAEEEVCFSHVPHDN